MKAPIENKERVLETLRVRLNIAEVVVVHSRHSAEPPEMQHNGALAAADLREAIRFIEEHAEDEPATTPFIKESVE